STKMNDQRVESDEDFPVSGIPLSSGIYILFWLQGWEWDPWTGWTPWVIAPPLPIIFFDISAFGSDSDDEYRFNTRLNEVEVYELAQAVENQPRRWEPDVYAMVARTFDTTDYYRMTPEPN